MEIEKKIPEEYSPNKPYLGSTDNEEVIRFLSTLFEKGGADAALEDSTDLGGHGNTKFVDLTIPGHAQSSPIFLKPFDLIEARNYQKLIKIKSPLLKHMPKIYGEITREGTKYLVMENLKPGAITQLADIKLAGKLDDDANFNPIACKGELKATGKHKSSFSYNQMKLGANSAPHYMIAENMRLLKEKGRLFNYRNSRSYLNQALQEAKPEEIERLKEQIVELLEYIKSSEVAFIGVSLALLKNERDQLSFKMIDPAHVVLDGTSKEKGFYSDAVNYAKYKASNIKALEQIRSDLELLSPSPHIV